MLPVSIVIATTAMASGVEGGTFFAPLFLLALGLPAEVAIGTALITEVFGFASGLYAYARRKLIDYRLGLTLLMITIPMSLLGTWLAGWVDPNLLKVILSVALLIVSFELLRTPRPDKVKQIDDSIREEQSEAQPERCLTAADGEEICYTVCNKAEGMLMTGIGGLFIGMISTGQGQLNGFFFLKRCRLPSRVAVATSVFIVAITALIASTGHFVRFIQTGGDVLNTVLGLVIFTVPGVVIGGQIGPVVASRIPQHTLERALGVLFIFIAALILGEVALRMWG